MGPVQGYRRRQIWPRRHDEIRRPPNNFFDVALIHQIAEALEGLNPDPGCRAVVLAARGKAFCAGANFGESASSSVPGGAQTAGRELKPQSRVGHLYVEAVRLFRTRKPIVGAIHGPAVGGGLGLALVPDFRVTCPEARFFSQLHPARLPSGLRADRDTHRGRRPGEGGADVLYQPPGDRRGSVYGWGSPTSGAQTRCAAAAPRSPPRSRRTRRSA